MTINSFILILLSQLKNKWGRFILASGGIMIGVWSIALTTGLSLGARDTLIGAINSRPESRLLQIYNSDAESFAFTDLNSIPKIKGISSAEIETLKNENPEIKTTVPSIAHLISFRTNSTPKTYSCNNVFNEKNQLLNQAGELADQSNLITILEEYQKYCVENYITHNDFDYLYDTNKRDWYGQTTKPTGNDIVLCFKCGDVNLASKLGYAKPEDMVGKSIDVEMLEAAEQYLFEGEDFTFINGTGKPKAIKQAPVKTYRIVAVVDDREPKLSLGFSNLYFPLETYTDAIKLANPEANTKEILYVEYNLFVDNFTELRIVTEKINKKPDFIASALALFLVDGISNVFLGLSVVLALFGFIAFIASVFGIITVMFISVLERKKEIGILKSLGAKDIDIFLLFLFESGLLGIVGWVMGIFIALLTSYIIQVSINIAINSIPSLKDSLGSFNITTFSPTFPWWLYAGTLFVAVLFTSLSGIVPSISAARQNPVDVLRSE